MDKVTKMTKSPYYNYAVEQKENPNPNVAAYATLVVNEYDKWYSNTTTQQTFIDNTPTISEGEWPETINYIRSRMV